MDDNTRQLLKKLADQRRERQKKEVHIPIPVVRQPSPQPIPAPQALLPRQLVEQRREKWRKEQAEIQRREKQHQEAERKQKQQQEEQERHRLILLDEYERKLEQLSRKVRDKSPNYATLKQNIAEFQRKLESCLAEFIGNMDSIQKIVRELVNFILNMDLRFNVREGQDIVTELPLKLKELMTQVGLKQEGQSLETQVIMDTEKDEEIARQLARQSENEGNIDAIVRQMTGIAIPRIPEPVQAPRHRVTLAPPAVQKPFCHCLAKSTKKPCQISPIAGTNFCRYHTNCQEPYNP